MMLRNMQRLFTPGIHKQVSLIKNINFAYMGPKRKKNLSNPFQYQEIKVRQTQAKDKKKYGYLQFGMYGLVIACCFAAIPMYRLFCEHVGLVGNYEKKTYEFKPQAVKNHKKYIVKFQGQAEPGINWEFQPVEKQVIIGPSQTAIVFYRLYNKEDKPIVGFSTYNITPEESNIYFSKIQCFCFNQQMVNPKEQLLLPIFFYLEPQLAEDPDVGRIREIKVHYDFIRSAKQDLAKFAADEIKKMEDNKKKLKEMRAKKNNMSMEEYEEHLQAEEAKNHENLMKELEKPANKAEGSQVNKQFSKLQNLEDPSVLSKIQAAS